MVRTSASLRNITVGEIKEHTELLAQSRDEALKRMLKKARNLGVRFGTSAVAQGAAEVFAYGTAVMVEKRNVLAFSKLTYRH